MFQLDFFPRMDLQKLQDFQVLEKSSLSRKELEGLCQNPKFYSIPKDNEIIRHQHAQLLDRILGFRMKFVEEMLMNDAENLDQQGSHDSWGPALHNGVQTWVGLDLLTLQTPYSEMARIFQLLKIRPYQHIIDLGSAYGRMGVVIGGLYPKALFTGYEYVKARVDEGNRVYKELGFKNCHLFQQDLFSKDFELPEADIYFIYDYGQVEHIKHTLDQIQGTAYKRPVRLIARGKYTRQIINESYPLLEKIYESKAAGPYTIYQAYLK